MPWNEPNKEKTKSFQKNETNSTTKLNQYLGLMLILCLAAPLRVTDSCTTFRMSKIFASVVPSVAESVRFLDEICGGAHVAQSRYFGALTLHFPSMTVYISNSVLIQFDFDSIKTLVTNGLSGPLKLIQT